jgi:hypothetical protein
VYCLHVEATHERQVLFVRRGWLPVLVLAGVVLAVSVALLVHRPGSPPAGTVGQATQGWPALAIPHGDGGLRLQLTQSQGTAAISSTSDGPVPMQDRPFRLISRATGHVWRLRTDRVGRAQIAVPPGRYQLRLDWTDTGGPRWRLGVRAGDTLTKRLEESVG